MYPSKSLLDKFTLSSEVTFSVAIENIQYHIQVSLLVNWDKPVTHKFQTRLNIPIGCGGEVKNVLCSTEKAYLNLTLITGRLLRSSELHKSRYNLIWRGRKNRNFHRYCFHRGKRKSNRLPPPQINVNSNLKPPRPVSR